MPSTSDGSISLGNWNALKRAINRARQCLAESGLFDSGSAFNRGVLGQRWRPVPAGERRSCPRMTLRRATFPGPPAAGSRIPGWGAIDCRCNMRVEGRRGGTNVTRAMSTQPSGTAKTCKKLMADGNADGRVLLQKLRRTSRQCARCASLLEGGENRLQGSCAEEWGDDEKVGGRGLAAEAVAGNRHRFWR